MKNIIFTLILIVGFSGCTTKCSCEPKNTKQKTSITPSKTEKSQTITKNKCIKNDCEIEENLPVGLYIDNY